MAPEASDSQPLAAIGKIGILGAGAVGVVLGQALAAQGVEIPAVASRNIASAEALARVLPAARAVSPEELVGRVTLVLLAVPDDAIEPVARQLPWQAGQGVAHLSGARGADALAAAAERGAHVAALHPLMTFPRALAETPPAHLLARLTGCTWALETPHPMLEARLARIVTALGGRLVKLSADDRVPYHLSGVFASNYVVTLLGAATDLWATFGVPREQALQALLPLLQATVATLAQVGLPAALTGPVARGDVGTVEAHLAWLQSLVEAEPQSHAALPDAAALQAAYRALASLALPLGEASGSLSPAAAAELRARLDTDRAAPLDAPLDANLDPYRSTRSQQ